MSTVDETIVCRRFSISGRVQGVFFRDSTRAEALQLRLAGYARNLSDGTVDIIACGQADDVAALREWLQVGPPLARVDSVEESTVAPRRFETFTTA